MTRQEKKDYMKRILEAEELNKFSKTKKTYNEIQTDLEIYLWNQRFSTKTSENDSTGTKERDMV